MAAWLFSFSEDRASSMLLRSGCCHLIYWGIRQRAKWQNINQWQLLCEQRHGL
jgi:hypothetical protein